MSNVQYVECVSTYLHHYLFIPYTYLYFSVVNIVRETYLKELLKQIGLGTYSALTPAPAPPPQVSGEGGAESKLFN